MGLLDGVLNIDLLGGPGRTQRRGDRIFDEGDRLPAVLAGIEVRHVSESGTDWVWGVEVRPFGGEPFRAACHQTLPHGARDVVRLGMALEVGHTDGEVVLRWEEAMGGWRPAKRCDDGIHDARLPGLKGGRRDVVVGGWRPKSLLGVVREEVDLLLGGAWRTVRVPEWAGHLLATGTVLPVDDRGKVDWLAAIERHGTGVGVLTPPPTHEEDTSGPTAEDRVQDVAASRIGASDGDPGDVTFEQWVAVSAGLVRERVAPADHDAHAQRHGLAPGAWAPAEAAWKGRMMGGDWELGARYAQAYQRALKGR